LVEAASWPYRHPAAAMIVQCEATHNHSQLEYREEIVWELLLALLPVPVRRHAVVAEGSG